MLFRHDFNDCEMGEGDYVLIWQLNHSDISYVHSFYNSLLKAHSISFPWQSIWCVKVPKRVYFFLWTAAKGGILTIDNLVKNLPIVNWCCLCQRDEETVDHLFFFLISKTVDHLLFYCKFAHALWSEVFLMFGF